MPTPLSIRPAAPSTATATSATPASARRWAEGLSMDGAAARRLRVPADNAPTTGPASVQAAHALYKTWEDRDLGSVALMRARVDGADVWALHTSTDGDDGFLEVFDGAGSLLASGVTGPGRALTWDTVPGAVRDRVAPRNATDSVVAFHDRLRDAMDVGSPSGARVTQKEARHAAQALLGQAPSIRSVDGEENAALARLAADRPSKLTSGAMAYVTRLSQVHVSNGQSQLKNARIQNGEALLGARSDLADHTQLLTALMRSPSQQARMDAFLALCRDSAAVFPSGLEPASKADAAAVLRKAGATPAQAAALLNPVAAGRGTQLFTGTVFTTDTSGMGRPAGVGVFASAPGGQLRALVVRQEPRAQDPQPRLVVGALTGTDRPLDVEGTDVTAHGTKHRLAWTAPWGGRMTAELTVPADGTDPVVTHVKIPPVLEPMLREALAGRLATAYGGQHDVVGWVGRDNAEGPGFVVAHRPKDSGQPPVLSTIRVRMGGEATVTPKRLAASDAGLARDLAHVLARDHAQNMVADAGISDLARLEVALRTRWTRAEDLKVPAPDESPVGFDPATERAQFMLPNVWGDNAVVVTFSKSGTVRVEDVN